MTPPASKNKLYSITKFVSNIHLHDFPISQIQHSLLSALMGLPIIKPCCILRDLQTHYDIPLHRFPVTPPACLQNVKTAIFESAGVKIMFSKFYK